MRREWRRFVPLLAVCVTSLVTGTAVGVTMLALKPSPPDAAHVDPAARLYGPCLLGIIGDCARPTPPGSSSTSPAPTQSDTGTHASSSHPATKSHRPTHGHSAHPSHRSRVRTTVPGTATAPGGTPRGTKSAPVAATTRSINPSPAGTTLSASDAAQPTADRTEPVSSNKLARSATQILPILAIFLAVGVVVAASAARRGSRRSRGQGGRRQRQHRHAYSDTDELVYPPRATSR